MCGIAGFVGDLLHGPVARRVLAAMTDRLRHRGPDDVGLHLEPGVALGMRRLAVIDPVGGAQPVWNENGTVAAVFNGEIYNHQEIRKELAARGHRFRSGTDSEVLVHLYEEHDRDLVHRLDGMYAFAIWNRRSGSLLLARDRLGEKPLYWAQLPGGVVFASELKALLGFPGLRHDLDPAALLKYFVHEFVPAPATILAGVRKLPPAHLLVIRAGRPERPFRYWRLPPVGPRPRRTIEAWTEELRNLLDRAVRTRLVSDVPLGTFLSGGIDSSTITAIAAHHTPSLATFSMGFREPSFDETREAERVARHLGTDHRTAIFDEREALALLPRLGTLVDEPLADPSILPTFLLSRFTRGHVTVALSGDGGDELFAGYPTYAAHDLARRWRRLPRFLQRTALALAERMPVSHANLPLDYLVKRFLRGADLPLVERHLLWLGATHPAVDGPFLDRDVAATLADLDPLEDARRHVADYRGTDDADAAQYLDLHLYLADDILAKVDRASMATSLEVRAPFLDHRLVEFAFRCPPPLRRRGLRGKRLLARAMAKDLPERTLARKKKGFGIPVSRWLTGPLRPAIEAATDPARLARQGLFDPLAVRSRLEAHLAYRRDERKFLWCMLVFQSWLDGLQATPPVPAPTPAPIDLPQPVLAT